MKSSLGLGVGPRYTFQPHEIAGLKLWLQSDRSVTLNGTSVSAWGDSSTNRYSASQASPSKQPTYNASDAGYNGKPTLSFSAAASQALNTGAVAISQPATYYVVGEVTNSNGSAVDSPPPGNSCHNIYFNPYPRLWAGAACDDRGGTSCNVKALTCAIFNGASSSIFVNNSATAEATGNAGAGNPTSIGVGGTGVNDNFMTGKLAAVLAYSGVHTATQRRRIFEYLGSLFAITIQ